MTVQRTQNTIKKDCKLKQTSLGVETLTHWFGHNFIKIVRATDDLIISSIYGSYCKEAHFIGYNDKIDEITFVKVIYTEYRLLGGAAYK